MDSEPLRELRSQEREGANRHGDPGGSLIQRRDDECVHCWGCIRSCPARAIGFSEGETVIIEERCVACGACVSECGGRGHVVRDDTPAIRALLASSRPVVAVLATESVAALHPRTPEDVESGLEAMGFFAAESTLLGEEMVASEYERFLAGRGCLPTLRSTCPVVVSWVCRFHPRLVETLVPLVPPYVAQARLVKELYPADTAVVYVSPCYARKDECRDPQFEGAVDAVIDFVELEEMLECAPARRSSRPVGARRPSPIKELSLTDGFPRRAISGRDMTDAEVSVVRGLRPLDQLLEAITMGEAAPGVVDMLHCEGCLDGPAVAPQVSVFTKRNIVVAESERRAGPAAVGCARLLAYLPQVELRRTFTASPVLSRVPSADEVDRTLAEGEFHNRDDTIDCGACGYTTCAEHAGAIVQGRSTWEMCWPLQNRRLERSLASLEQMATTDPLTSLWNRRVFERRLEEETERHTRYGDDVSLLMIDLDGFKQVNDAHGHQIGDAVLCAVGEMLRGELRATDLPARYGGDEFGVILPGIGKTAAFAVAEKIRAGVAALGVPVDRRGGVCAVTASIGVSACSTSMADGEALVEAADRAMYRAKESGRNRVGLAPD